jgi:hypothetical protein
MPGTREEKRGIIKTTVVNMLEAALQHHDGQKAY